MLLQLIDSYKDYEIYIKRDDLEPGLFYIYDVLNNKYRIIKSDSLKSVNLFINEVMNNDNTM